MCDRGSVRGDQGAVQRRTCGIVRRRPHAPKSALDLRHTAIPIFGLIANLACMAFYIIGPFMGYGTAKEPLLALGIALVWALYGGIYFMRASKAKGRTTLVGERGMGATS